jgi:hypothetical protein
MITYEIPNEDREKHHSDDSKRYLGYASLGKKRRYGYRAT